MLRRSVDLTGRSPSTAESRRPQPTLPVLALVGPACLGRPMPERVISPRFDTRWRRCGSPLTAGTQARWNPTTKWTACVLCPPKASAGTPSAPRSSTAGVPAAPGTAPSKPSAPRTTWQAIVDYHLAGVRLASIAPPPTLDDTSRWAVVTLDREDVITGRGDTVPISSTARRVLTARTPDDAIHYDWPLVALTDESGRAHTPPSQSSRLPAAWAGDGLIDAWDSVFG